ncbi:MAG TPA: hypothetical protein EYN51_10435 [Flavobacteriales bacterium]|nr:hypothetical protein [Flavobacteriales bacterium]
MLTRVALILKYPLYPCYFPRFLLLWTNKWRIKEQTIYHGSLQSPPNVLTLNIFTRWGDAIFHTEDITVGWNGLANNGKKLAQTGVYVWLVLSKDLTGVNHKYTGHVTLMR